MLYVSENYFFGFTMEVFYQKLFADVLQNFAIFAGKHLCVVTKKRNQKYPEVTRSNQK